MSSPANASPRAVRSGGFRRVFNGNVDLLKKTLPLKTRRFIFLLMNTPRRTTKRNRFQVIAADGTPINLGASTFENATKRLATFSRYTAACKAVATGATVVDSATDERFSFAG